MGQFQDQIVVITGGVGNVGKATATAFADQGATVVLLDYNEDGLKAALDGLNTNNKDGFTVNLLEAESVNSVIAEIQKKYGRIDVLANIAGGFSMGPGIDETSDKDWEFMMNLNARSVFYASRAALPDMIKKASGRIINVSARAALYGAANMGPYCASKAAVKTLTETLANETKDKGITVNCIMPGTVDTPENRESMPDANHSSWVPTSGLANVILFLASDAATYVTGAAIPVYGQS